MLRQGAGTAAGAGGGMSGVPRCGSTRGATTRNVRSRALARSLQGSQPSPELRQAFRGRPVPAA